METIADLHTGAFGFVLTWRNRLGLHKKIMQPSGARETGSVSCVEQITRTGQECLGIFAGQELQEAFWTDTCPAVEYALEVIFTKPGAFGYFFKLGLVLKIIFKIINGFFNALVVSAELLVVGWQSRHV